jgi:hypothetical protein
MTLIDLCQRETLLRNKFEKQSDKNGSLDAHQIARARSASTMRAEFGF